MPIDARFVHVNIVARNWRRLAQFYAEVFGCVPLPPERDLAGEWLETATDIPEAHIRGVHLRLPGHGAEGPTLEIFQYEPQAAARSGAINAPGIAHVAFAVDDVAAAQRTVLAAGGGVVGEPVTVEVAGAGSVTFVYLTDPEGNIIELQRWS